MICYLVGHAFFVSALLALANCFYWYFHKQSRFEHLGTGASEGRCLTPWCRYTNASEGRCYPHGALLR